MEGLIDKCKRCLRTVPCRLCVNGGGKYSPADSMLGRKVGITFLWRKNAVREIFQ